MIIEVLLFSLVLTQPAGSNFPASSSIISALPSRNVGFTSSGRMGPFAVYEKNTNIMYVSSCNGGVLKTADGGHSFDFVFDKQGSANIGAVTMSQKNPDVVWVGTGDQAMRNGVGRGDGVYKSLDGGKTWQHMGLEKSHTIGKIVIDPRNDDVVFVAALGGTWGYNKERGIYKTKDGGKTWKQVLYHDEKSSGNDIIQDPKNPNNLLASLWDKVHRPYGWFEWGPGSGIYRSTDNGETWKKVTAGLPTEKVGRICMDYCRKDPNYVAAIIQEPAPMSRTFRSKDGGKTWQRMKAIHKNHTGIVKDNLSEDGGPVWYRAYYNHVIAYDPNDVNKFYYGSLGHYTTDGGDTWEGGGASDVHGLWINPKNSKHKLQTDDYALEGTDAIGNRYESNVPPLDQVYGVGYDMRKLYWVTGSMQDTFGVMVPTQTIYGNVSALDALSSWGDEGGKPMMAPDDWAIGYNWARELYFGTVDLKTGKYSGWSPGKNYVYCEPKEYIEYQKQAIKLRGGWYGGGGISPWDPTTIYLGGNYLYKSTDRGQTFDTISPDLTHDNPEFQKPDDGQGYHGDPSSSRAYQTIRAVAESPLKRNMIWVGTDCGYVQLTMDGGKTWTNLTKNIPGIPDYCWVSHVYPSRFSEGRCYVTMDNHRNNDMTTYVFVTEDYGKTWTKITGNLPKEECCFVIKEGLKNPDLLYLGTEFGLYISLDRGKTWDRYQDYKENDTYNARKNYFPTVAVFDLEIHPRELDLIIGCHGRGVWIMPAKALEEMTPENRAKDVYFCSPGNVYLFPNLPRNSLLDRRLSNLPRFDNTQPGTRFCYYLKQDAKDRAKIQILKASGQPLDAVPNPYKPGTMIVPTLEFTGPAKAGLNSIAFKVSMNQIEKPGDYRVVLTIDGKEYYQALHIEDATDEVMSPRRR